MIKAPFSPPFSSQPRLNQVETVAAKRRITLISIRAAGAITLPDDLSMGRVHEVITGLEDRFKLECPEVYRVTIHPEPVTDNSR